MSEARITPGPMVHHVYPIEDREHVLEGTGCWCEPHLYRLCTACDGDGIIPIEAIVPGDWILVVHHFIPDDATFVTE